MKASYWIWLGMAILGVGSCVCGSSCAPQLTTAREQANKRTILFHESKLVRVLDAQLGVACYRESDATSLALSCVQISLPETDSGEESDQ